MYMYIRKTHIVNSSYKRFQDFNIKNVFLLTGPGSPGGGLGPGGRCVPGGFCKHKDRDTLIDVISAVGMDYFHFQLQIQKSDP